MLAEWQVTRGCACHSSPHDGICVARHRVTTIWWSSINLGNHSLIDLAELWCFTALTYCNCGMTLILVRIALVTPQFGSNAASQSDILNEFLQPGAGKQLVVGMSSPLVPVSHTATKT